MVRCAIKGCGLSKNKFHPKLTLHCLPKNNLARMKWLNNIGSENLINIRDIFICSVHFEESCFNRTLNVVRLRDNAIPTLHMPNDMLNYMEYRVMGSVSQMRMKPGCVPTKFTCQPDRRKGSSTTLKRSYILNKKRRIAVQECEKEQRNVAMAQTGETSGRSDVMNYNEAEIITEEKSHISGNTSKRGFLYGTEKDDCCNFQEQAIQDSHEETNRLIQSSSNAVSGGLRCVNCGLNVSRLQRHTLDNAEVQCLMQKWVGQVDNSINRKENTIVSDQLDQSKIDNTVDQNEDIPDPLHEIKTEITDESDVDDTEELLTSNVCRVCLAEDVKMYDMKDSELSEMFQNITGIAITANNHFIMELLCWECAARLKAAAAFRNKALLSEALLQDLVTIGEQIRKTDITSIKETYDNIKSDLSIHEVVHVVHIDDNGEEEQSSISENIGIEIVQNRTDDSTEFEDNKIKIKEEYIEMEIETHDEPLVFNPIKTEMEVDPFNIKKEGDIFIDPLSKTTSRDTVNSTCTSGEGRSTVIGPLAKTSPEDTVNSACTSGEGRSTVIGPLAKTSPEDTVNSACTSGERRNIVIGSLAKTPVEDTVNSSCTSGEGRNIVIGHLAKTLLEDTVNSACTSGERRNIVIGSLAKTPVEDTVNTACTSGEKRNIVIRPHSKTPPGDAIDPTNANVKKSSPQNTTPLKVLLIVPQIICEEPVINTDRRVIREAKEKITHDHTYMKRKQKVKDVNLIKHGGISKKVLNRNSNLNKSVRKDEEM